MVRAVVVTQEEVTQLAKELISKGEKPTIGRVRELLGNRGSPNTISRYLKHWRDGEIDHIRNGDDDLDPASEDMNMVADFTEAPSAPLHSISPVVQVASVAQPEKFERTEKTERTISKPELNNPEIKPEIRPERVTSQSSMGVMPQGFDGSHLTQGTPRSQERQDNQEKQGPRVHQGGSASQSSHSQVHSQSVHQGQPQGQSQNAQAQTPKAPYPSQSGQVQGQGQNPTQNSTHHPGQSQGQHQQHPGQSQGQHQQHQGQSQGQHQQHQGQSQGQNQGARKEGSRNQNGQPGGPGHNKQQSHHQKSGNSQSSSQPSQQKSGPNPQNKPAHVPRPVMVFEDSFPNVMVSENLDTLTTSQLVAKVRRLESILNKEQSRRESADAMARDAKEYAEAVKVQVGARINDIRQSMEMVIDSLQSQLKSMRENAEKDLRFYRDSLELAKDKLAQQKAAQRNS